jgi:hypothetical protein
MNTPPQERGQPEAAEGLPCSTVPDLDSPTKLWAEYGSNIIKTILGGCIAAALFCLYLGYTEWQTGKSALHAGTGSSNLGEVGSYLQGASGSAWALAGFFILLVAFLVQAMTFAEQRKQFEQQFTQQRKQFELESIEQRTQFKAQSHSLNLQNFEFSFFQLLSLHNQIVLGMTSDGGFSGRGCFQKWYEMFRSGTWGHKYKMTDRLWGTKELLSRPENGIRKYEAFYHEVAAAQLGHYFRNLYHLFKFVDRAEALSDSDPTTDHDRRKRYTSLVRATLSQHELAFLFYNCASWLGEEKFKPLVERYGLLKNFKTDDLLETEKNRPIFGKDGIYSEAANT